MTKPLHPAAESLKAGQTLYIACYHPTPHGWDHYVHSIQVTGSNRDRYPAPVEGCIIDAAPVDWLKIRMSLEAYAFLKCDFFYSKRKAISRMKELQRGERKWN
ncbi:MULTISPECIES: hypothetical protein [unclassified Neptuniibacter]|uniref:hypothetical protein n=1 Tax=unclassified Neptuniibacter TaxID=2630693 RepID=UPI000C594F21|nr:MULTISPECIES: hypothetical protein [unclassified Neptuniibacter]MAY41692.1 hypothetical protein [Oceanospirillaceae bacterium]|tara:strand:- start:2941 stop:3249 length:309 start_codon:yes stop_codon:yes gene_type:complete